jgi:hypothetical protein
MILEKIFVGAAIQMLSLREGLHGEINISCGGILIIMLIRQLKDLVRGKCTFSKWEMVILINYLCISCLLLSLFLGEISDSLIQCKYIFLYLK